MGQSQSLSQTHIGDLPNEVVFSILQYLPPQEMKSAVLVCKSLSEMGEKPRFWTWAVVTVNTKDDLQKLKRPRLQKVQEIDVTQGSRIGTEVECTWIKEKGLADLFQVIAEIPTVRRIRGLEFCKGIQDIEPDLVVGVFNSLEELKLCYGEEDKEEDESEEDEEEDEEKGGKETQLNLTTEQLELLFKAAAEKTNLKFLQVSGQEMDEISPELFAASVSNVEEVLLKEHFKEDITSEQFKALYAIIAAEDRSLRKLTCLSYYIDPMGDIDPDLLSKAFNRLEEFTAYNCGDKEQLTAILSGLMEGGSRLKSLMVEELNPKIVQNLDQNLVRRAKEKIGEFYTTEA